MSVEEAALSEPEGAAPPLLAVAALLLFGGSSVCGDDGGDGVWALERAEAKERLRSERDGARETREEEVGSTPMDGPAIGCRAEECFTLWAEESVTFCAVDSRHSAASQAGSEQRGRAASAGG